MMLILGGGAVSGPLLFMLGYNLLAVCPSLYRALSSLKIGIESFLLAYEENIFQY